MIFLPQNPCCTPTPAPSPCGGGYDPCTAAPIPTNNVSYSGPNLPCTGIHTCDSVTVALQKVDEEICDLQHQINILINALNVCCTTTTTTSTSTSSTTTTTTTIACPSCEFYSVSNETITPAIVNYYACGGVFSNATVGAFGVIYLCACTDTVVVPPLPGITLTNLGACPTTTTTTSSSSTTTTTTTAAPVECFCYEAYNPTGDPLSITWTECGDTETTSQIISPGGTLYRCSSTALIVEPGVIVTGGTTPCTGLDPSECFPG